MGMWPFIYLMLTNKSKKKPLSKRFFSCTGKFDFILLDQLPLPLEFYFP